MIVLYSYPELFGVADNNGYGLKVFAFMRLAGVPFTHERKHPRVHAHRAAHKATELAAKTIDGLAGQSSFHCGKSLL